MFLHVCSFKLLPNKNYMITNVCLLLFELGKVTNGHPCIYLACIESLKNFVMTFFDLHTI